MAKWGLLLVLATASGCLAPAPPPKEESTEPDAAGTLFDPTATGTIQGQSPGPELCHNWPHSERTVLENGPIRMPP